MIVLDTDAAIAIAMGSQCGDAMTLLRQESEEVIAPVLIIEEASNVMAKYVRGSHLELEEALAIFEDAVGLVDRFVSPGDLSIEVMRESIRLDHPAYDLYFMVLARRNGATLFTLDRRLQDLCMQTGVDCIVLQDPS